MSKRWENLPIAPDLMLADPWSFRRVPPGMTRSIPGAGVSRRHAGQMIGSFISYRSGRSQLNEWGQFCISAARGIPSMTVSQVRHLTPAQRYAIRTFRTMFKMGPAIDAGLWRAGWDASDLDVLG